MKSPDQALVDRLNGEIILIETALRNSIPHSTPHYHDEMNREVEHSNNVNRFFINLNVALIKIPEELWPPDVNRNSRIRSNLKHLHYSDFEWYGEIIFDKVKYIFIGDDVRPLFEYKETSTLSKFKASNLDNS